MKLKRIEHIGTWDTSGAAEAYIKYDFDVRIEGKALLLAMGQSARASFSTKTEDRLHAVLSDFAPSFDANFTPTATNGLSPDELRSLQKAKSQKSPLFEIKTGRITGTIHLRASDPNNNFFSLYLAYYEN